MFAQPTAGIPCRPHRQKKKGDMGRLSQKEIATSAVRTHASFDSTVLFERNLNVPP